MSETKRYASRWSEVIEFMSDFVSHSVLLKRGEEEEIDYKFFIYHGSLLFARFLVQSCSFVQPHLPKVSFLRFIKSSICSNDFKVHSVCYPQICLFCGYVINTLVEFLGSRG